MPVRGLRLRAGDGPELITALRLGLGLMSPISLLRADTRLSLLGKVKRTASRRFTPLASNAPALVLS